METAVEGRKLHAKRDAPKSQANLLVGFALRLQFGQFPSSSAQIACSIVYNLRRKRIHSMLRSETLMTISEKRGCRIVRSHEEPTPCRKSKAPWSRRPTPP